MNASIDRRSSARPIVIVVDDEALVRRALVRLLEDDGFDAIECDGGEAALECVATRAVDLVLLDVVMPRMSGLEVCRTLKQSPRDRSLPVVFLTAQGQSSDVLTGLEAGADGYLEKPINPRVLGAKLRALLRFRETQRGSELAPAHSFQELLRDRIKGLELSAGLSPREQEVLQLLLLGRSVSDIGLVLGISPRTAKFHQTNVLSKLGAESRFDLFRLLM